MRLFSYSRSTGVGATVAKHCIFCLHIGFTAHYFGYKRHGYGSKLEVMTVEHALRWTWGAAR